MSDAASHSAVAKLPIFELMGFPITPVQVQLVCSAFVQEQSPNPTLTVGGMAASPHQVAPHAAAENSQGAGDHAASG